MSAKRLRGTGEGTRRASRVANLVTRLRTHLGPQLSVTVTDNRRTLLSFKRRERELHLRLHHVFLEANDPVLLAIAGFVDQGSAQARQLIGRFIQQRRELIWPPEAERGLPLPSLSPHGRAHDLKEIFDSLNRRFFENQIQAEITYGPAPSCRRPRNSIKLGSYSAMARLIRVHPALDQPEVPRFFVEAVVFHEMLHQVFPFRSLGRPQCIHSADFLAAEREFPHHGRAREWERTNLDLLLRY